jgi:hypothetical protein
MLVLYAKVASVSNKLMADYAICGRLSLLQVALEPLTYVCRRACAARQAESGLPALESVLESTKLPKG